MPPSVFIDVTIPRARPRSADGNSSVTIVIATAHSDARKIWERNCAPVRKARLGESAVSAAHAV